ncbi:hypothetical protein AACH10_11725 [Ideonella sp. DXS22W]|uniref:Uncharacterized protein n=1 Tax=Pseudaquabacterium inlustre TaxID=2984192 RepID=A0ABU9CGA8_9BURK
MSAAGAHAGTAWQNTRLDDPPSSIMPPDAEPVPAPPGPLAADLSRLFQALGMQQFRAFVVDTASMACESTWAMDEHGALVDDGEPLSMESALPGSNAIVAQLANASLERVIDTHSGVRGRTFAWRMDALRVVIVKVRYHARNDRPRELDIAMARLLCNAGLLNRHDGARPGLDGQALAWSQPVPARPMPQRTLGLVGAGLGVAAAALAAWLALGALPAMDEQSRRVSRHAAELRSLADETLAHGLTTALASGDYGEVQNQLSAFESLGYFRGALITNARQRVVAIAGQVDDTLRIGIELPDGTVPRAQTRDLSQGAERYGRLVVVKPAPQAPAAPQGLPLRSVALVTAGAAALAALLAAWGLRRRSPG